MEKALEKDVNLRYQHASDMRTDLQRLKRDTSSGRYPISGSRETAASTVVPPESRRRWWWIERELLH